jgi:hypothetical protein
MSGTGPTWLLARMGRPASVELGVDPATEDGLGRWLVLSVLESAARDAETAGRAFRVLDAAGAAAPGGLAKASPTALEALLAEAGMPRPEALGPRLVRLATALEEGWSGSLETLASDTDGLDDLGRRLASLASGVGASTVLRFLRPLRDHWSTAADTPSTSAALAAARHLGWADEHVDESGLPGVLAAIASEDAPLAELESALDRLGARSCLRERPNACPLGEDCPRRRAGAA